MGCVCACVTSAFIDRNDPDSAFPLYNIGRICTAPYKTKLWSDLHRPAHTELLQNRNEIWSGSTNFLCIGRLLDLDLVVHQFETQELTYLLVCCSADKGGIISYQVNALRLLRQSR
jgi:hypothetical protein